MCGSPGVTRFYCVPEIPCPASKSARTNPLSLLFAASSALANAGVLAETRKREFYEKPTQERKRKAAAAVKRQLRRSSRDVTKRQRLY